MSLKDTLQELGLEGHRFNLAQKRAEGLISACFDNVEAAEAWLKEGYDSYVCCSPVKAGTTGKASDADVLIDGALLVDCDPRKDDEDPTGTSTKRRDAAWNTAMEIWEHFGQCGTLVDSGRGGQVWLKVPAICDRHGLLAWIREHFKREDVEIDATHEVSRLMRLPGTTNTRTGETVTIVAPACGSIPRDEIEAILDGWTPPSAVDVPEADRGEPSRLEIKRFVVRRALEIWREDPMEIMIDRSKRDFLFVVSVLENGASLEQASRLLHALPGSKAAERGDDAYWISTARSAAQRVEIAREQRSLIEGLVPVLQADPAKVLEGNTIKALGRLYLEDYAGWAALRAQIQPIMRGAKISIADVDKLVKAEAVRISDADVGPPDEHVIFARSRDGGSGAWKARDVNGGWTWVARTEAAIVLSAVGLDTERSMALAMTNPFSITVAPFEPRVLPGRVWNESDARFAVEPVPGDHPTWDQLFTVVGRGLDRDVEADPWCRANGILTGADYLRVWSATMLQAPASRRAYLFLYSREQGTGKSLFFEAHRLLIGNAVVKANNALTNDRGFNGELRGAVLAYTEEVNLGQGGGRGRAYNRIKDYSLSQTLSIEGKGEAVFEVPNVVSWGQAANDPGYCPIFEGDDRVTVYQVMPPEDAEKMPKEVMRQRLEAEAPAVLATLLSLPTPKSKGRYVVPPIMTEAKAQQARASRDDLTVWLGEHPEWVTLDDKGLCDLFRDYLASRDLDKRFWPPQRILRSLPEVGDAARQLYHRMLRCHPDGGVTWSATEADGEWGLGGARRAAKVLRALAEGSDRVETYLSQGVTRYRLSPPSDS